MAPAPVRRPCNWWAESYNFVGLPEALTRRSRPRFSCPPDLIASRFLLSPALEETLMRIVLLLLASLLASKQLIAGEPPVIRTARSGAWSAADTWEGKTVPGAGSRVLIRAGHRVDYDVSSNVVIR